MAIVSPFRTLADLPEGGNLTLSPPIPIHPSHQGSTAEVDLPEHLTHPQEPTSHDGYPSFMSDLSFDLPPATTNHQHPPNTSSDGHQDSTPPSP